MRIYFLCRQIGRRFPLIENIYLITTLKLPHTSVSDLLNEFRRELDSLYGKNELEQVLAGMFELAMGLSKTDLMTKGDLPVPEETARELGHMLVRLKANEPLQYVLGEAWFMGMKLNVNHHVLIPRPETEELADWVIRVLKEQAVRHPRILDACTGSGCIALALKKNFPAARVSGTDSSMEALHVARKNGECLGLEVHFRHDDILNPVEWPAGERFDVIVSNPPYIGEDERPEISGRVKDHEPEAALFTGDKDSLIFYRAISDFALNHLAAGGFLFFEINSRYGLEVCNLLAGKGFVDIELRIDLSGADRLVMAKSPKFDA